MKKKLISLVDIHKSFGEKTVLRGLNLEIAEAETTAIIGKSGEGKSVLLKHIIGLMKPDRGEILYRDKSIFAMNKEENKSFRKRLSYMFQGCALFDSMNIFENIALPLSEAAKLPKKVIEDKVQESLVSLDLKGIEKLYPSQISGGMMKRVAMARALITDPEVVLFDEPTTGLDPIRKNSVHNMIKEYQKRFGFTAVVITHEIPDIFDIAQNIVMLDEGRIIFTGSPEEIEKCEKTEVYNFIRGQAIDSEQKYL